MVKSTITRPDGTFITIEGSPEELKNVLNVYENNGLSGEKKKSLGEIKLVKKKKSTGNKKINKGLSKKLNNLILDGFFDEAKTSKEIIGRLKLLGYSMPVTSLPSYLIPKLHNEELERKEIITKNGKIYGYLRKSK